LPEQIDLSKVEYADFYKKVKLETADGKTKTGKPIVYGITVPTNAENPELGLEFVKFVIGDAGQKIFADMGQPPIVPSEGSGNLPEELKSLVYVESAKPKPTPTPSPKPTSAPTPTPKTPGFVAVFAVAGILAIGYLVLQKKRR
jgi:ABC-type thiamine transport system substrate-binding protein